MERFAIKIDKSVKARLKNLCRLCGIDNPNQIEILNAAEWIDLTIDGEVTLSRKIADCVGIQVTKNDRMPQKICAICVDKINDFHEFREMCHATNEQTRKLLNLPDPSKVKQPKKITIKKEDEGIESIFGIVGSDVKAKPNQSQKSTKKSKKNSITSTVTSMNENRFRGMTKREIEITLELERIKREEEEELDENQLIEIMPTNRTKNAKKKKNMDAVLLAPKEPNQRERKREIEQKRIEKKRKSDAKTKAPAVKKIKREPGVSCSICEERFDKIMFREIHMAAYHQPAIVEYGCSSCHDQFQTTEENTEHHEWHQQFNVPYKCVVCSVTFDKLIAFQRHLLACMHPSYASITTFSKSFYCDLCNTDFETQNLYDWHDCLIGNNSPCPICQRVFIKKTVLMKHIFKCTGPAGAASESPKKVGRPKKKKKEPYKNRLEIPPQNSFKLEPETIIEQNMDVDDGYEAIDNSFMDSHFGDSDGFDENDSIITPAQPVEETQPPLIQEAMEANASQTNIGGGGGSSSDASDLTGTSVRTNLNRPLLECRVKLEPIDVSSFTNVTASTTASDLSFEKTAAVVPPLIISRPALTVPPLTIRIKKEVIQPGYGDEFDANLAKNIKQEKSDEIWELASNHKKSKEQEKQKKLYKKPALLAIKIKQEKMDRETNDDEQYNDVYDNFSIPLDNLCETSVNQNPYENSSLPIITQIHSVIDSPTINQPNTMIPAVTSSLVHNVPFVPIRIKSEFHKPTTPPLINHFDECSSNKTVTTITTASPASIPENIESISTEDDQHGSEIDRQTQITECDSSVLPSESEPMDSQSCEDTSKIINIAETSIGARSDETLTTGTDDIVQNNDETVADSNENQLIAAKQLSEKVDDNVQNENEISSQKQDETHEQIHEHEKCQKIETNKQPVVATIMDFSTEIDENVNSQHSMELNKEIGNNLSDEQTAADEESEQVGNVIKPICEDDDRNSILDAEVTNASISPIDFSESNANDDSLNFIDQLVHEVADTMVPAMPNDNEPESTIQIQNVPDDSSIGRFDEGNFAFATGCPIEVAGGPNENIELNAVDIAAKDSTTDSTNLLTMPDMPDIDYNDLLPVLNSTEVKSNGTEVITNLPVDNDATNDAQMANLAESNAVDEVIQPKISVFENTTNEPNCNSNTSNESL